MRAADPPWYRPLLGVRRAVTHEACAELALAPWDDPHNHDNRFTRVRLRTEVLPLLEDVLGGGVAEALARTAAALREDTDALDEWAEAAVSNPDGIGETVAVTALTELPTAVRRRVIRRWLLRGGAANLTDKQIRAVDALVTTWHGQGGVAVGSDLRQQRLFAARQDGRLMLYSQPV
jgi:tRNA(Ile)-lysidine synthase